MKKIITSVLFMICFSVYGQTTCCSKPKATDEFAMLTKNKKFVSSHDDPLPFVLEKPLGKEISFATSGGKKGYAYEVGDAKNSRVIFMIHEWWGLNDYIKQEAEHFAKETGARVIALDLYDKKVAANKDSASKYMSQVNEQRLADIILSAIKYVGPNAKIATVGWCFGGGWSMQASILAGRQAKACVIYYGMPENNFEKLSTLSAPVLFVFAQKDEWVNKDVLAKFELNMKNAGKKLTVKSYDAYHAFANPSNPHFEKKYMEDAFSNTKAFLNEHLK